MRGWLIALGLLFGVALAVDFPLERLSVGLAGYGLTAGPGNAVERFGAEVLGVVEDAGLGFPLVLVRASGPVIEAAGGVAAGMSGSPVYLPLDGEEALLGAVGYVFPRSDHRLALVTPIAAMRGETVGAYPATLALDPSAVTALGSPQPVATPVLVSGLSARALTFLEPLFSRANLTLLPVQGGGAGGWDEAGYTLAPGSAVSAQLVRGDVSIAAIGTLTSLEPSGDFLAFGHPLLAAGAVAYPLAPAYVVAIVPNLDAPFKLANAGAGVLGAFTEDRLAALAGVTGAAPEAVAVSLSLRTPQGARQATFGVIPDERFYAPLLAAAALHLLDVELGRIGPGTAEVAWDITLGNGSLEHASVRTLEQTTDPRDIAGAAASLVAAPLALLAENVFADPQVRSVAISLEVAGEERYAELARIALESDRLTPGEAALARVRLQPFRGEPLLETLTLNLPPEAEGELSLRFWGGLTPPDTDPETARNPLEDNILSFGELLEAMRNQVQSRELVVDTVIDGETVRLARRTLPLPIKGEVSLSVTVGETEGDAGEPTEAAPDAPSDPAERPERPTPPDLPDPSPPLYP